MNTELLVKTGHSELAAFPGCSPIVVGRTSLLRRRQSASRCAAAAGCNRPGFQHVSHGIPRILGGFYCELQ